jgi:hypothetical protein
MTATTTFSTTRPADRSAAQSPARIRRSVWRTGVVAGVAASIVTTAFAALMHAVDVSLKVSGQSIPALGFGELTLVAALIGTVIAVVLSRRSARPRRVFLNTTIALTLVSLVPDVLADAHTATRFVLAGSHLLAAAILIPALASSLAVSRRSH